MKRPVASDVSVVIPTLGRELLEGCLESIAAGTAWPAEVIVVDQGSSSSVASWIDRLTRPGLVITHVRSSDRGIAAGTNRGLERVRTRFVATTHDDCRVQADWMERLSARTREVGDSILTGRVEPRWRGHRAHGHHASGTDRLLRAADRPRRSLPAEHGVPDPAARTHRILRRAPVPAPGRGGQRVGVSGTEGGGPHRLRPGDRRCAPCLARPEAADPAASPLRAGGRVASTGSIYAAAIRSSSGARSATW